MSPKEIMQDFRDRKYYDEHSLWISDHLNEFFADDEISVFHEIFAIDFKVHVYFIQSKKQKFNILLTSGMSLLEMNVSNQMNNPEDFRFSEIMLLMPKEIKFEELYTGENKNDWIISMLKQTAKFPHHYDTWIGLGHTIQATSDLESYSDKTNFVGGIILPSVTFGKDFTEIKKRK